MTRCRGALNATFHELENYRLRVVSSVRHSENNLNHQCAPAKATDCESGRDLRLRSLHFASQKVAFWVLYPAREAVPRPARATLAPAKDVAVAITRKK